MADFARYLTKGKTDKEAEFKVTLPGNGVMNDLGKYLARSVAGSSTPKTTFNTLPKVN